MTGLEAAQARYDFVASLLQRDVPPPAALVELGSAPGHQVAQLARRGYEATSVDLGAAEDEWGSGGPGEFRRMLREAGVRHVEWDLERIPLPFEDESFDVALMTEVLEHLREYPARSLSEARRILRPGGLLYVTTPNAAYVMKRLRLLMGKNVQTPLHDWIAGLPHARHAREYTFGEVRVLLQHAGFVIVGEQGRHFHIASGNRNPIARTGKAALNLLARTRPTLGPAIVMVARRPT